MDKNNIGEDLLKKLQQRVKKFEPNSSVAEEDNENQKIQERVKKNALKDDSVSVEQVQANVSDDVISQGITAFKKEDSLEQTQTLDAEKTEKADVKKPFNPFEQSASEFRKAEDSYLSQIEELKKEEKQEEEKIKVSQIEQEEIAKEQAIAEREAKLRIQRQELAEREAVIKKIEDERIAKEKEEERVKKEAFEAERRKKEEQEERLRRLEQEEALQMQKLAELEAAEKKNKEIADQNSNIDKDKIEELKQSKVTVLQKSEKKKKMPGYAKVLIAFACVLVVAVTGFCIWKFVINNKPTKNIISVDLTLDQTEFFEGDELIDITKIDKNYLTVVYDNGETEKVALSYDIITADFVSEVLVDEIDIVKGTDDYQIKMYINAIDTLATSTSYKLTVDYKGFRAEKDVLIKPITDIGTDVYFDLINSEFAEFDYLFYDDIGVTAILENGDSKYLTPMQYDLYIQYGSQYKKMEKVNGHYQLPSLVNLGYDISQNSVNPVTQGAFNLAVALVGEDVETLNLEQSATMNITAVSSISVNGVDINLIKTIDLYSYGLIEDSWVEEIEGHNVTFASRDVKQYVYEIMKSGVTVEMNNNTFSVLDIVGYAYYDGTNTYQIKFAEDANGNLTISKEIFNSSTDGRLFVYVNEFVPDVDNNQLRYSFELLNSNEEIRLNTLYFSNFGKSSVRKIIYVNINKDYIVSCEIPAGINYAYEIFAGDTINEAFLNNFVNIKYTFKSGKTIMFNNYTNTIIKVNGEDANIELNGEDDETTTDDNLDLKLKITKPKDKSVFYRWDGDYQDTGNPKYLFTDAGVGYKVTIYLKCNLFEGADYMASVLTERVLQP